MSQYNLNTLLHRSFPWRVQLPDGSIQSGISIREIPVRIPRIQRDYAEGRDSEMIERKRYNLLNDMIDVVYGNREELSFDFIYGYIMNGDQIVEGTEWQNMEQCKHPAFEPLDGQQRLTTLFLFYWLFGRGKELKRDDDNHSLFIYETRDSSEEFCHWLVEIDAEKVIVEWKTAITLIKAQNKKSKSKWNTEKNYSGIVDPYANRLRYPLLPEPSLFEYLQSLESFKWDWHDDPNIHSMIRVLESAIIYLQERGLDYKEGIRNNANLDNITFILLDNLQCDGDQLFEKMNARGKALTSFEILKSSMEEEMERQELSKTDPQLVNNWRNAIDGDWIDFCWDTSDIGENPDLQSIRAVEKKLERLLVRMMGKSFFSVDVTGTIPTNVDAINYTGQFIDSISKGDVVNQIFDRYLEYARYERSVNNLDFSKLNFSYIFNDIENLIFKDPEDCRWKDVSSLLPKLNRDNELTILDEFMRESPTHDIRVMIYALLAYLEIVPAQVLAVDDIERGNFIDWMRFIRNVFNSHNKNSRLDNFSDVKSAISAVDKWLGHYKSNFRKYETQNILRFIVEYIKNNPFSQEQSRLDEEALKAELRIYGSGNVSGKEWERSILKAEENYYLWGQIIAPLSWCRDDSKSIYDIELFDKYIHSLNKLFDGSLHDNDPFDALLIQTMLCYDDYRHNYKEGLGSLGRLNNHRDYSWKRYLRELDENTGKYGVLFKRLIDNWLLVPTLDSDSFLRHEISSEKTKISIEDWRYYIVNISSPNILLEIFNYIGTNSRYIFTDENGRAYIFRSDTLRTYNRYELLTTYLAFETSIYQEGVSSGYPTHINEEAGAYVDFTMPNEDTIRLSLNYDKLYKIEKMTKDTKEFIRISDNLDLSETQENLIHLGVIKHF